MVPGGTVDPAPLHPMIKKDIPSEALPNEWRPSKSDKTFEQLFGNMNLGVFDSW
jgi:hypothetical protein